MLDLLICVLLLCAGALACIIFNPIIGAPAVIIGAIASGIAVSKIR